MPGLKRAASYPAGGLSPVPLPTSGPSGWFALGLGHGGVGALVGLSLVEKASGGHPATPAAVAGSRDLHGRSRLNRFGDRHAGRDANGDRSAGSADRHAPTVGRRCRRKRPSLSGRATPDKPGPVDQARPPLLFITPMAFDRRAWKIVAFADLETWAFDVCTNTWTQMHPERRSDAWDPPVYDVDLDAAAFHF